MPTQSPIWQLLNSNTAADAPCESQQGLTAGVLPYTCGLEPMPRQVMAGYDSGLLAVVIGMLALVAFSMRHYKRFFAAMTRDMVSVRDRSNAFDDHTLNETRIIGSLVLLSALCQAILLMGLTSGGGIWGPEITPMEGLLAYFAITAGYIGLQYPLYWTLGYVFTSKRLRRQWVRGFSAVQSMLGLCLLLPAMVVLFYPSHQAWVAVIGVVIYIAARIVFIYKGFRIFFHNLFSIVYFILYLCSAEIIPILLIYQASLSLSKVIYLYH